MGILNFYNEQMFWRCFIKMECSNFEFKIFYKNICNFDFTDAILSRCFEQIWSNFEQKWSRCNYCTQFWWCFCKITALHLISFWIQNFNFWIQNICFIKIQNPLIQNFEVILLWEFWIFTKHLLIFKTSAKKLLHSM